MGEGSQANALRALLISAQQGAARRPWLAGGPDVRVPAAVARAGRRPRRGEGRVGTVRDALQLPDMRRIELSYGLSITGELAGTVALVVYAVNAGGAGLVAAYAASRTLAGMGVALVLTGITGRLRRDRLLRWITGARMILLAAAALLAASGQPPAAVIAAGAVSSALAGTYRPLQAAVLPWLVRTPARATRPPAADGRSPR